LVGYLGQAALPVFNPHPRLAGNKHLCVRHLRPGQELAGKTNEQNQRE
jgi:hypothetical protein